MTHLKDNSISLVTEDGNTKEYKVILTFETEENDNFYIVYTDGELDEDGFIKTYAGIYTNDKGKEILMPVESDEEWQLIENLLMKIDSENED